MSDYGKKFSNFAKMYIRKSKYSGKNNSFTFKLAIFNNIYSRAIVPFKACIKVYSTILKSLALDYYYSNINITNLIINFDHICYLI